MTKKGLGKGLDALIPSLGDDEISQIGKAKRTSAKTETVKSEIEKGIATIKISKIEPNREQPRKHFNEDSLEELAASIKEHGIIEPLIVQKKDDMYEIVAGERRWRAAKLAGIKEVPVIIKDFTTQEAIEIALIENIQRDDLNPIEEANAYKRLMTECNLKQDKLAERVSKSRTAVTNSMRLLKLCKEVQELVIDGLISSGHARALLAVNSKELQISIANKIIDNGLNVRETEKLVKKINEEKDKKNDENTSKSDEVANKFVYEDIESKIKDIMGTKVAVKHKANGKGKIEIEYYSNDELERIYDMLMSIKN